MSQILAIKASDSNTPLAAGQPTDQSKHQVNQQINHSGSNNIITGLILLAISAFLFASISEKNATFAKIISENIFLQIKNCTFAVLNLKVKTRKNFTLEIVEQCTNVTIYSILFENEENNEFIKFI